MADYSSFLQVDYNDLIGAPFKFGGRGPEEFDCYGLVMEAARRNDRCLPDFGWATGKDMIAAMMGATLPQWEEIDSRPGAVVLIRIGRHVSHVGYQIDHYRMIHAWDQSQASIVKLEDWQHRIVGFYKHVG